MERLHIRAAAGSFLLFFILGLFYSSQVFACQCEVPTAPAEAEEYAAAVFSGEVLQLQIEQVGEEELEAALVEVEEVWKGIEETQTIVYTNTSSCRFSFEEGEEYLLYPVEFNSDLHVYECFAGGLLADAEEDLEILGDGSPPENEVNLEEDFEQGGFSIMEGMAIIAIGGVALVLIYFVGQKLLLRK